MASGNPDYSMSVYADIVAQTIGQISVDVIAQTLTNLSIDVNAQSLSEIVNRPKYGASQAASWEVAPVVDTWIDLVDITAQGVLYGGYIFCWNNAQHTYDKVRVTMDGVIVFYDSFYYLATYYLDKQGVDFCYIINYDEVLHQYSMGINPGITFESSLKIEFDSDDPDSTGVIGVLIYATV